MRNGARWVAAVLAGGLLAGGLLAGCAPPPADPVGQAKAEEAANALPRDAFYEVSPDGAAGRVLRAEKFTGWRVPAGATGTRLVYNSRSAQDRPVAASAAVLTPAGTPPAGGWPVIAWAHGTSGVARQCAPSLMQDLYYPEIFADWLGQGYAVVAADYSGLGAGEGHEYLTLTANARDVRYAVAAARTAMPELGARWVAVGHSQGGQTVWGVARQEVAEPTGKFLGSVALAPVTPYDRLQERVADNQGQGQYLAYVSSSIALQHKDFKPADMLTEAGLRDYDKYLTQGCWGYGRVVSGTGTPRELLRPNWSAHPAARAFVEGNRYATAPLAGPIFVVAGATDKDVAADTIAAEAKQQCRQGTAVTYREYPGGHDGVLPESAAEQARWVKDRFAGVAAGTTC
ncbi:MULTISPECIES: lipase family protein [unclassified Crossiella]|uniref:alpha/beta hydrolase n=1 Tax=unclassified Crossiella TaxID=2620835 RepID=UPI001FFF5ED6|nr:MULTISPECIES: lipase family protein [unclassified Crossiella]MCK2238848.1 lipase family protein [Crossiella sp. S99.2]MCK2251582.1 lipase family protein [Crossiella sp. S99.1]